VLLNAHKITLKNKRSVPCQNHQDLSHLKFFCSLSLLYSSNCQGETDVLKTLLIIVIKTLPRRNSSEEKKFGMYGRAGNQNFIIIKTFGFHIKMIKKTSRYARQ